MAAEHVVGITANVLVVITAVDQVAETVGVRVIDSNQQPITAQVILPMGLVDPVGFPIVLNDVVEEISTGRTAAVRFVHPNDPAQWSPAVSGTPLLSTLGWKKVGTFTPTP